MNNFDLTDFNNNCFTCSCRHLNMRQKKKEKRKHNQKETKLKNKMIRKNKINTILKETGRQAEEVTPLCARVVLFQTKEPRSRS